MKQDKLVLVVPISWQWDMLPLLRENKINFSYAKTSGDLMGGSPLSQRALADVSCYIKRLHESGVAVTYPFDGTCFDNIEWTAVGQRRVRKALDQAVSLGFDAVSVSMPYWVELIKKKYPMLQVEISSSADVDNLQRAKRWEQLGADVITLASFKLNRNFPLLKTIRHNVDCGLQLVANHCCLNHCIDHSFHVNALAHEKIQGGDGNSADAFCHGKCMAQRLNNKFEVLASQWIRPEDVHCYEDIGINRLMLLGADVKSEDMRTIIKAYVQRAYDGDFLDLAPIFLNYLPGNLNGTSTMSQISVNNADLKDFMTYFSQGKCSGLCDECAYCKDWAQKVIRSSQKASSIS